MNDVWVWDVYRSDRFVKSVRVLTFKDVNVEELTSRELELPKELALDESFPRDSSSWGPPPLDPGARHGTEGHRPARRRPRRLAHRRRRKARTVEFAFDGSNYEIDLSNDNVDKFREAISDYVAAARKVSGRRSGGS
ncbi:hypothetical protein PTTG_31153, partial [Puccinia triticina 1-1 BBBD Race 1]